MLVLWVLIFGFNISYSQTKALFGVFAGGAYYQGELNWSRLFYNTHFAYGLNMRYVLNSRYALKGNLVLSWLSANDKDFKSPYQQFRRMSFTTPIAEIGGHIEFNFKKYIYGDKKYFKTPYIYVGGELLIASWSHPPYNFAIPFGIGYKVALSKKLEVGGEYGYRKVFSDGIDNITGIEHIGENTSNFYSYKQIGFYNNKDWYSLFGIHLLITVFSKGIACDVYDVYKL